MIERIGRRPSAISVLQLGNPTGMYGAERWILALVKHLDPDKIRSIVGVINDEEQKLGPPQLCIHAAEVGLETVVFDAPGRLSISAVRQIRQFVLDKGVDIVHSHGYKTDIVGRLATLGTQCRSISTPHGWTRNPGLKLRVYEAIDRLAFLHLDLVVPLSEELYTGLAGIPYLRRKLRLVRNGVDISEIDAVRDRESSPGMQDKRQSFRVGYIGRLIGDKRLDTLLKAFQSAEITSKKLTIIGDGPKFEELVDLAKELGISDEVEFLGFRDDRIRFLLDFDVFVLPSRGEGIPRCLLESMAAEVPVVATDIRGCRDVVTHNVNGLLFDVGDHKQLTHHLENLAMDDALCRRLREAALETVQGKFSAKRMADEYVQLFQELIACRRKTRENRNKLA